MAEIKKRNRHKWVKDRNGKECIFCLSRINSRNGLYKYIQGDGKNTEPINWYPECILIQLIETINN